MAQSELNRDPSLPEASSDLVNNDLNQKAIVSNGRNAIPCQYPVRSPSSSIKCGSLGTN